MFVGAPLRLFAVVWLKLLVRETVAWSAFLATSCNIFLQEHSRQIRRFQCFTKNQDEPYNCAQIKLTTPRYGGSLWEMLLSMHPGDCHDQEQDSEVRRIGAG